MNITVSSRKKSELIDITAAVQKAVQDSGFISGLVHIFSMHTTAGITINENADPDVPLDIIQALDKAVPWFDNYHHREGNSAAHVKTSLFGSSEIVAVDQGRLVLGTWQAVFFCEFDGPRKRTVRLTLIPGLPG
ncbi:MAG: secondary thiamine-phosphate synthase enzyme YjbQ [Pseudomonadota bacterium]